MKRAFYNIPFQVNLLAPRIWMSMFYHQVLTNARKIGKFVSYNLFQMPLFDAFYNYGQLFNSTKDVDHVCWED